MLWQLESSPPIAWIDVEPAANKAVVRFKEANSAAGALEKLTKAFDDGKIMYRDSQLTGRLIDGKCLVNYPLNLSLYFLIINPPFFLSGDEELEFWKNLLAVLSSRKRKGGRQGVSLYLLLFNFSQCMHVSSCAYLHRRIKSIHIPCEAS